MSRPVLTPDITIITYLGERQIEVYPPSVEQLSSTVQNNWGQLFYIGTFSSAARLITQSEGYGLSAIGYRPENTEHHAQILAES